MRRTMKLRLIKLAISITICVVIFRNINFQDFWAAVGNADPKLIAAACFMQFSAILVASYRYSLIAGSFSFQQPFSFYNKSYFKGMFFNQALPTTVGGDALRVMDLIRTGRESKFQCFLCVMVDRLYGLFGLTLITFCALLAVPVFLPLPATYAALAVCAGYMVVLVLVALAYRIPNLPRFIPARKLKDISFSVSKSLNTPGKTLAQLSLTLTIQLISVLTMYCLSLSVGVETGLQYFLVVVPLVFLLAVLPISFAGWGVREASLVAMFAFIGADTSKIMCVSIIYGIILIIASLPGLWVYICEK